MATASTASTGSTVTLGTVKALNGTDERAAVASGLALERVQVDDAFGVTATAYADGDAVDTTATIPAVALGNGGGGSVVNVKLTLAQSMPSTVPSFVLHLFHDSPSSTVTDNAALDLSEADMRDDYVGSVALYSYRSFATDVHVFDSGSIDIPFICGSTHDDLFAVLEIKTATTFSADELQLAVMVAQDR